MTDKNLKLSIVVPCFNEENNVVPLSEAIIDQITNNLSNYDYELIFIDNCSGDSTRSKLEKLCSENPKIKAIFNIRNFGPFNSPFYGLCQASGDCVMLICADFQDPVELIPKFVHEWEAGNKIVIGIKKQSEEGKFMRLLRTTYYRIMKRISNIDYIEHFTGFGLYDKSFLSFLRLLNDPSPFLRGIVAEFGEKRKEIFYKQKKRKSGKSSYNFFALYDALMLSITSYTKVTMRIATICGGVVALIDVIIGVYYLIRKLTDWNNFSIGIAPLVVGFFFLFSIVLIFMGLIGEYVLALNTRIINRPLVVEEKRINFNSRE